MAAEEGCSGSGGGRMAAEQPGRLRYGQCWEDADRLVEALSPLAGRTVLSIASGGENSLALLAEGPARLVVIDHNPAQIALVELKLAAMTRLPHRELLLLLGATPAPEGPAAATPLRWELYQHCRPALSAATAGFWDQHPALIAGGLLRAGRFERYLEAFRRWLLPLVHGPGAWAPLLAGLSREQRLAWYDRQWNTRRWRWLFHLMFSRTALGHLGTDPSQVRYGDGSQTALLLERLRTVLVELDPRDNPYLHWILQGHFSDPLPRALRPEVVAQIRRHRDRIELQPLSLAAYLLQHQADRGWIERFNLSNVFEYQSPEATTALLGQLHRHAAPGARLVGWNRLADRDGRLAPAGAWRFDPSRAEALHRRDRLFFYRRLLVAEARPLPASASARASLGQVAPTPGLWPADESWQLRTGEEPLGAASLWWRHTPPIPGERVGAIGHLQAADGAAAQVVLEQACRRLAEQGCTLVLAPMDGNTWNGYRCRTGPALGFAGEPSPGPEWIARLHGCGFTLAAHYLSARSTVDPRALVADHTGADAVRPARWADLRILDLATLQRQGEAGAALLPGIHALVRAGFRRQPYFLPIEPPVFERWLAAALPESEPAFTLLAFDGAPSAGAVVGLLLAQRQARTLVVRTLVVRPGRRWAGLGRLLLAEAHRRAWQQGCTQLIHALMHEGSASRVLSRTTATPCSGYVLLERPLGARSPL